jgi:hypothetical protein
VVVYPREYRGKDVGFEPRCIQQVVLEQLACAIGFGEHLQRQVGVRLVGQLGEPIL